MADDFCANQRADIGLPLSECRGSAIVELHVFSITSAEASHERDCDSCRTLESERASVPVYN